MMYKYSDRELSDLAKTLVFLIDTREQKNQHIIDYFSKEGISSRLKKLDSADYSFFLPKNPEMDILRDIYFNDKFCIERKRDIDELAINLASKRQQFENEFERARAKTKYLVIESGSYEDIYKHAYISQITPKMYLANLIVFEQRYNLHIAFVSQKNSPAYIVEITRRYFIDYMNGR